MLNRKVGATGTAGGAAGRLPAVSQGDGVAEGSFVKGEPQRVDAVQAAFAVRSSLNCSTKAKDSYLQTVKVLYCFALTYVAIEARGKCTDI